MQIYIDDYIPEDKYPVKATDYILENLDINNMRIYNDFDYGSYLEFRGLKVFLDSRSEIYCEEYNDVTIFKDFIDAKKGFASYKEVFSKYDFTHILLRNNDIVNQYIKDDNNYTKLYNDDTFILYEKRN